MKVERGGVEGEGAPRGAEGRGARGSGHWYRGTSRANRDKEAERGKGKGDEEGKRDTERERERGMERGEREREGEERETVSFTWMYDHIHVHTQHAQHAHTQHAHTKCTHFHNILYSLLSPTCPSGTPHGSGLPRAPPPQGGRICSAPPFLAVLRASSRLRSHRPP